MPYNVNFTDKTNTAIPVYDNVTDESTSLKFPGRNVTGYGQVIAENFLHLLENFASPADANGNGPANPIEGQLWYNTTVGTLEIFDGIGWKAAGNIQKSATAPSISEDKVGEIWVDTVKQQLYVWSGKTWVLVGPQFSSENGLRTGVVVESISDTDNTTRNVIKLLSEEVPIAIISRDSFVPKISITGFDQIKTGININTSPVGNALSTAKLYGTAQSAESLIVAETTVQAAKFLRSDIINTTEYSFNVRNNQGITLGIDGTFRLTNTLTSASIYNATPGSSIDLQVNSDGNPSTTLRVIGNKVGINLLAPQVELDVQGSVGVTNSIRITGSDASTSFTNGSFTTKGGAAITKNLFVGTQLEVGGTTTLHAVLPKSTSTHDIGSSTLKWGTVYADSINAGTLKGVLDGDVAGNARTSTNLRFKTSFQLIGDVQSNTVLFDGSYEGLTKTFTTKLTADIISGQDEPFPNVSKEDDQVLVYRGTVGLLKQTRDVFVGDLGVPIGAIMPFAGTNLPDGYLLCDGSEQEKAKYKALYDVIGDVHGVPSKGAGTFVLPDLRGRFALGLDNMDNGTQVPNISGYGGYTDSGGGTANRIPGTSGKTLGGSAGAATNSLNVNNLPQHRHNLEPLDHPGVQYSVVRLDSAPVAGTSPGAGPGPTAAGQAQYLNTTGGIDTTATLGTEFSILNPYLSINYIIRSGMPAF
jgi:microcystin-dependent protein